MDIVNSCPIINPYFHFALFLAGCAFIGIAIGTLAKLAVEAYRGMKWG